MTQPDLFDAVLAREAGEAGQAQAEANAEDEWKAAARAAIASMAAKRAEFSASDLWEQPGFWKPRQPKAIGPMLKGAQGAGLIEPTGRYVKGRSVVAHGRPEMVWRSLVFGGRS